MKELPKQVSESVRRRNPELYGRSPLQQAIHAWKHGDGKFPTAEPPKPPKRIRQSTKPLMNKLEQDWFEVLRCRWSIVVPQGMRFMLANGVWYKPDFIAFPCGLESQSTALRAYECKGPHAFRGGKENLKLAAHKYPYIVWTLVWKHDGKWQEQRIYP
jgi:hypothetical protein